ncbi:22162_t:CDS:2 [Gigaspora rosea]|nr:22162_t:CDS:2 [Gigaspora rosea]
MCGFGDKDRRPIDPPPVVRLFVSFPNGTPESESSIDHTMMTVHAALWSEDCKEERILVNNPSTHGQATGPTSSIMSLNPPSCVKTLAGSCASSAYLLRDHTDQRGIYFIFQDLSVRIEGAYTLKFSFTDLRGLISPSYEIVGGCVAAEAYSAPFRVYSAKKFPESTALSKAFASQGIKLTIRKNLRYQRINDHPLDQMNEHTTTITTSTPSNIIKSENPDNPDNPVDDTEEFDNLSHEEIKRER